MLALRKNSPNGLFDRHLCLTSHDLMQLALNARIYFQSGIIKLHYWFITVMSVNNVVSRVHDTIRRYRAACRMDTDCLFDLFGGITRDQLLHQWFVILCLFQAAQTSPCSSQPHRAALISVGQQVGQWMATRKIHRHWLITMTQTLGGRCIWLTPFGSITSKSSTINGVRII